MNLRPYEKFAEVYDSIASALGDRFYKDYYDFTISILKGFKLNPRAILELACGTGKLATLFLDNGYDIEGLDISRSMLNVAEEKGLKVHQGNMVSFKLNRKYDLILCIYDSLNYIQKESELEQCFKSVINHLNQDGLFIFDMNSDYKINKMIPNFRPVYTKIGDIELIQLNSHEPDTWIPENIFFQKTEDEKYVRFYEKHIEKAYRISTVRRLLKKAKFKLIDSYSDFQFNKIRRNTQRWFFICKPNAV